MRAIEKFAARRRVRRSYHAKAAWTRTRSRCNEEAIWRSTEATWSWRSFRYYVRDYRGRDIGRGARIDIMRQREIREYAKCTKRRRRPISNVIQDISSRTGSERHASFDTYRSGIAKNFIPLCLCRLSFRIYYPRAVWEAYNKIYFHLKIIHSFAFVISVVCCW